MLRVHKNAPGGKPITTDTDMDRPYANFSDETLHRIAEFFEDYKPIYQDRAWAEEKKAQVAEEIRLREQQDEIAHQ